MSHPRSPVRRVIWGLLGVAILLFAATILISRRSAGPDFTGEVYPPGSWSRGPVSSESTDADERARLLSLPYVAGKLPAAETSGVVRFQADRAQPGLNFYVSGHGPEALLIDLEGRVLHRWAAPFRRAFPSRKVTQETTYWRRARLLENGDVIAIFQGGGMIRLDTQSRLLWSLDAGFYNDIEIGSQGTIYSIHKEAQKEETAAGGMPILEDFLVEISPSGEVLRRTSLLGCFRNSPFEALLEPMRPSGDILHSNTVERITSLSANLGATDADDLFLVSLREVDIVAIVDRDEETVVWAQRGPWDAQHDPTLLADGSILLFDNKGNEGRARAIRVEPLSGEIIWEYSGPPGQGLYSPEAGAIQRLDNGNTLITESERGRALEVAPDEDVVWEYLSPHRAGRQDELVAVLFDLQRVPARVADLLADGYPRAASR